PSAVLKPLTRSGTPSSSRSAAASERGAAGFDSNSFWSSVGPATGATTSRPWPKFIHPLLLPWAWRLAVSLRKAVSCIRVASRDTFAALIAWNGSGYINVVATSRTTLRRQLHAHDLYMLLKTRRAAEP